MREGSTGELGKHIENMTQGAKQQRKERRQASYTEFGQKLVRSAEGGAKVLHSVTKSTPLRGGAMIFQTLEEHAAYGARIRAKCQE